MAPIFFVSFVLMAQFVLVNVVVAVLMKHLEESHKLEQEDEEDMAQLEAQIKADEMEARTGSDGVSTDLNWFNNYLNRVSI